jgi:RNA polymerase sigma-70 factor (ECF subfamily)
MSGERFSVAIEAARAGDESAWSEIYSELAPAVLGYLRGSGVPDPEDTLGETFLQVARDLGRFEGDWARFKAWVFTIAHHRLIDARRSAARRPVDLVPDPPEPEQAAASDAAELAMNRIGEHELAEVLEVLSDDQRAVVLLRVVADLSIEDVATTLGKRAGAIKQLQRRGLAAVKRELDQKGVTQ